MQTFYKNLLYKNRFVLIVVASFASASLIPIWRHSVVDLVLLSPFVLWVSVRPLCSGISLGILLQFHSERPFIIWFAPALLILTASRICLFVGSFLDRSLMTIRNFCLMPPCFSTQCLHNTECSLSWFRFSICSPPFEYPLRSVSPLYGSPQICSDPLHWEPSTSLHK